MAFENLLISRIVIHEIFRRTDDREMVPPTYGTDLVVLDQEALDAFCDRVTSAMGSAARSMEMEIVRSDQTCAIAIAKALVDADDYLFIKTSRAAADRLTEAQTRRDLPGGVLAVFAGSAGYPARRLVGFLKAETHTGFTRRVGPSGAISLQFLKELLLTPQTKLYKIGVFIENDPQGPGPLPDGWKAFVYDDQMNASNKLTAAQYFYEAFLGCGFPETNARRTREFHDYTQEFLKAVEWPEERKTDLYNALVTYLKVDQSPTIQVATFAQTYLPDAQSRDDFTGFMNSRGFPQGAVLKDLSEVRKALRYRKVTFSTDIKIIAPAEKFKELVQMRPIPGQPDGEGQAQTWTEVIIRDQIRSQE